MKVKTKVLYLKEALNRLPKVTKEDRNYPGYSTVLIEATDIGRLKLTKTSRDMTCYMTTECKFYTDVEEIGSAAVSLNHLKKILFTSPGHATVEIRDDEDCLHVTIEKAAVSFPKFKLDEDGYPELKPVDTNRMIVGKPLLSKLINSVLFSISEDETRPHINCVLFEGDGEHIRMVSTDGHRLAKSQAEYPHSFSAILSTACARELAKMLKHSRRKKREDSSAVAVCYSEGDEEERRITFESSVKLGGGKKVDPLLGCVKTTAHMPEVDFPPYDQVIPAVSQADHSVDLPKDSFLEAVKRVHGLIVKKDKTTGAVLQLNAEGLTVEVDNPEDGTIREKVDADYQGGDVRIAFNINYLKDVLSVVKSKFISMHLWGNLDPGVFTCADGVDFCNVIMPMRI